MRAFYFIYIRRLADLLDFFSISLSHPLNAVVICAIFNASKFTKIGDSGPLGLNTPKFVSKNTYSY